MNLLSHITIAGAFSQAVETARRNQSAGDRRATKAPARRFWPSLPFTGFWINRSA